MILPLSSKCFSKVAKSCCLIALLRRFKEYSGVFFCPEKYNKAPAEIKRMSSKAAIKVNLRRVRMTIGSFYKCGLFD
jgi:hypothetical protein